MKLLAHLLVGLLVAGPTFSMTLIKTWKGKLSPKSVHHNGKGLFFAQNMHYRRTVTVYNRKLEFVKTIKARIRPSDYGYKKYKYMTQGGPVEAAFTHNGKYAWITNYNTYGSGFPRPGRDSCKKKDRYTHSFVYKIDTEKLEIVGAVAVGSVPKAISASPDNKLVVVSNWCSWDLSIIDTAQMKVIKTVQMYTYPRDTIFDLPTNSLYVSQMGGMKMGILDLTTYKMRWIRLGLGPRKILFSPDRKYIYISLKWGHQILKMDKKTHKILRRITTGKRPASMELDAAGKHLYVVNHFSNTMSKVRTADMKTIEVVKTPARPIGLAYDKKDKRVWISCYGGYVMVYQD